MPASPLTPADRQRILDLHATGMSRNDIARETGRSTGSVTAVVKKAGGTFDRTMTEAATAAKKADAAALRAQLELDYLEDAQKLRKQLWEPCIAFNFGGKDNTYEEHNLDEPVFADKLKIMQASTTASSAALRIDTHRNDGGMTAAVSLVDRMLDHFGYNEDPPAETS